MLQQRQMEREAQEQEREREEQERQNRLEALRNQVDNYLALNTFNYLDLFCHLGLPTREEVEPLSE